MHNTEDDENPPPLGFVATQPAWPTQVQAQNKNDGLMDYDEDAHGTCDDDGPPESGPDAEANMLQEYYAAAQCGRTRRPKFFRSLVPSSTNLPVSTASTRPMTTGNFHGTYELYWLATHLR